MFRFLYPVHAFLLLLSFIPPPAFAQSLSSGDVFTRPRFEGEAIITDDRPVLLTASEVYYDQQTEVAVATGAVEVVQGDTVLLADQLIYDIKNNTVTAHGNVSMLEPSGSVYFADALELRDNFNAGTIRQFKARLMDDSLFAAASARRIDKDRLELHKAVYSPCKVECSDDPDAKKPQWQIRASHVLIDQEAQKVTYDDVTFDVYGMPVFYTPYFSHATPGADNKSGLLMPEYSADENLGSIFRLPFYYAIAPDRDMTLTPMYTSLEAPVMIGEYRQRFDSGSMILDGSITRPEDRTAFGNPTTGNQIRGHFNATGKFDINDYSDWGFDIHRTTDDTYLRRYSFSNDTLLTSKAYLEGFNFIGPGDRTYGLIQGVAFQGLTATDDPSTIPYVVPLADFTTQSEPGFYNSRFLFSAGLMALGRDVGAKSRRLSSAVGWKLPFITDDGQIIEFNTQLRGDVYLVEDVALSDGRMFDGTTGRLMPEASLLWRYPFINRWADSSLLLEPVVHFAVSPGGGNPEKIPNEDSLVPEFTDTNLFSSNRFAGYDRIENGPRLSYGLRGQAQLFTDKYVDWLFGQHYRIDDDRSFPLSNELDSHFSDYVGRLGVQYSPVTLAYRFRLDRETLAARRNELDAGLSYYPFSLSGAYLSLKNDPVLDSKEELVGSAYVNLTKNWIWMVSGRQDLLLDQITSTSTGLTFRNECTNVSTLIGKEYTRDRDIKPTTTFLIRISLKNLE